MRRALVLILLTPAPVLAAEARVAEVAASREAIENLSREILREAREAEWRGERAARAVEAYRARAAEARRLAESVDDTQALRLQALGRIADRRADLAEARARLAADRLRRLEAELATREADLEAAVAAADREADLLEIRTGGWDEARIVDEIETAGARLAAARAALDTARREAAAAEEAKKKESLRRQALRLALVRLESRAHEEAPGLVAENRLLETLAALAGDEEETLEGIRAAHLARAEIAEHEAEAWRAHQDALRQALVATRFRNLLSPTGERRATRVVVALALAAALYLLARLRPMLPPLLLRLFPDFGLRREVSDAAVLLLGLVFFATALAAALGYADLAFHVLGRGLVTVLGLGAVGAADVWLETVARRRGAEQGLLAWFGRVVLLAAGVVVVIAAWDLPWRHTWEAIRPDWRAIAIGAARLTVLVGLLLGLLVIARRVGTAIIRIGGRARAGRETPIEREQRIETLVGVFRRTVEVVAFVLGVFLVLREVGIDVTPLLAGAGIAGIAVGLAAQSLIRDFLTGFFILLENQYTVGDVVQIGDKTGLVENVGLRTTTLRDLGGTVHVIPNGEITRVSNMTHEWSRAVLDIGVGYGEDIDRVRSLLERVGKEMRADPEWANVMLEDPQVLGVDALGDSAVVLKMVVKTEPIRQWDVARELRRRIKKAFDEEGIEIPFPQRTVWHRTDPPRGSGA